MGRSRYSLDLQHCDVELCQFLHAGAEIPLGVLKVWSSRCARGAGSDEWWLATERVDASGNFALS